MAENNGLSLQKAAQSLTKGELAGYRMDLEEFRHRSQLAGLLTEQMEKELDNASRAVRVSRLQATKDSLRREMQLFYGKYDQDLSDHLQKQFSDTYAAVISQLGLRPVLKLPGIDADLSRMDAVIRKPWAVDGLTFSQRLWKDQNLVVNTLHQTLTRQVALSLPPDEAVKALVIAFPEKSMRSAIGRLVMTESNAIATAGNREAYKATGVKQYEIVATLDSHTSAICQEMDGKRFPISKMEVGVTAPPFHPWCRTTTAPYDPDFEGILPPEKRAARDEDGKTYLTEARTYKEWVAEGNSQSGWAYSSEHSRKSRFNNEQRVAWDVVHSVAYKDLFNRISDDRELNQLAYKKTVDMLAHRTGTLFEDMYVIDMETKKVIGVQTHSTVANMVEKNHSLESARAKNINKLVLHNHGSNLPPSGSDIVANGYYGNEIGLVACHDGSVYLYRAGKKSVTREMIDTTIDKYKKAGYNDLEAYKKAFKQLKGDYGIWVEKL